MLTRLLSIDRNFSGKLAKFVEMSFDVVVRRRKLIRREKTVAPDQFFGRAVFTMVAKLAQDAWLWAAWHHRVAEPQQHLL